MIASPRVVADARRTLRRLRDDRRGMALLEFALGFPVLLAIGGWGVELSYLALTNLKVSQYALNLADNASRVGVDAGGGVSQIRESDVNDIFFGSRQEGKAIALGTNGRVILSSLENKKQSYDTAAQRRIHWQRCFGLKNGTGFDSSYGTTTVTAGTTSTAADQGTVTADGMGDPNFKVVPPPGTATMFVEINYQYKPIFGSLFVKPQIIHHTASLVVRDNRDLTQIYNFAPAAARATCDLYAA